MWMQQYHKVRITASTHSERFARAWIKSKGTEIRIINRENFKGRWRLPCIVYTSPAPARALIYISNPYVYCAGWPTSLLLANPRSKTRKCVPAYLTLLRIDEICILHIIHRLMDPVYMRERSTCMNSGCWYILLCYRTIIIIIIVIVIMLFYTMVTQAYT